MSIFLQRAFYEPYIIQRLKSSVVKLGTVIVLENLKKNQTTNVTEILKNVFPILRKIHSMSIIHRNTCEIIRNIKNCD